MSNGSYGQGQKDSAAGQPARDVKNEHWKVQQDYNAGYAAGKNKRP